MPKKLLFDKLNDIINRSLTKNPIERSSIEKLTEFS